jgi:O-antigen/teichoic acid export membrane protein
MNPFVRSVLVLVSGTAAAQAVGYLIAPILTRIYGADEMGELAIYMRAVSFLAALATLRYELSLPLPKRDDHSFLLYRLSFRIALLILALVGVAMLGWVFSTEQTADDAFFYGMVLLSSVFLIATNLGIYWAIRMGTYALVSRSRVTHSLVSNLLRWLFGVWGWSVKGLLLASLFGYIIASAEFVRQFFTANRAFKPTRSRKKSIALGLEHKEFPVINLPHVMVDLGRDLLIALLIAAQFSKDVFGWYSYAYTMLRLPVALLGASIGQVLMNRCATLLNERNSIAGLFRRTVLVLAVLAFPVFTVIFMYGTPIFAFVFGEGWSTSGDYSSIMAPWLMVSFITSSVSVIPVVLKKQRAFFFINLVGTSMLLLTLGVLPMIQAPFATTFEDALALTTYTQTGFSLMVIFALLHYTRLAHIHQSHGV